MPPVSRETLLSLLPDAADPQQLQELHDILATVAVERGLIGPRETPRLWERHIANSAWVVLPSPGLVPLDARVADIGSGAGLPGLVWAVVRPDLDITLVEPLLRRSVFLQEAADRLELSDRVSVLRSRAEALHGRMTWDFVTARAVAPLDRLVGWTLPLLTPDGALLALKGDSAEDEIERAERTLERLQSGPARIVDCGGADAPDATRVIVVPRRSSQRG